MKGVYFGANDCEETKQNSLKAISPVLISSLVNTKIMLKSGEDGKEIQIISTTYSTKYINEFDISIPLTLNMVQRSLKMNHTLETISMFPQLGEFESLNSLHTTKIFTELDPWFLDECEYERFVTSMEKNKFFSPREKFQYPNESRYING